MGKISEYDLYNLYLNGRPLIEHEQAKAQASAAKKPTYKAPQKTPVADYNPYQDMLNEMRAMEQERLRRQKEQAQAQYTVRVGNINKGADEILRQAYISKMQSDRQTPQQLKALGISGGLSETTLQNMNANYQNNRNKINAQKLMAIDSAVADRDALNAKSYDDFLQGNINYLKTYGLKSR